jgi:segregation and condensation protein A
MEFVCAFIAILESARQRTIRIMQNRMFGDIRITAGARDLEYVYDDHDEYDGEEVQGADG